MNTDLFAIGVISVSDASQLLKSEKVRGSIELRENGASLSFSISAVVASHGGEMFDFVALWHESDSSNSPHDISMARKPQQEKNNRLAQRHDERPVAVSKYVQDESFF